MRMFAWMDICGSIGHSVGFEVGYDGDGAARIDFAFEDKLDQLEYELIRKSLLEERENSGKEPERFDFE
jgi:hypothetical protein